MSDRTVTGAVAAVGAILTLLQSSRLSRRQICGDCDHVIETQLRDDRPHHRGALTPA